MGVDAGHQTLGGRLLITGGAVDLASHEQAVEFFEFQRGLELGRIEVIVLHGISRAEDSGVLHARNEMEGLELNFHRQRRRETLEIVLVGVLALGLEEKLMIILVRENAEFVFYARAVARAPSMDHSGE